MLRKINRDQKAVYLNKRKTYSSYTVKVGIQKDLKN